MQNVLSFVLNFHKNSFFIPKLSKVYFWPLNFAKCSIFIIPFMSTWLIRVMTCYLTWTKPFYLKIYEHVAHNDSWIKYFRQIYPSQWFFPPLLSEPTVPFLLSGEISTLATKARHSCSLGLKTFAWFGAIRATIVIKVNGFVFCSWSSSPGD